MEPDQTLTLAEARREWGGLDPATALLEAGIAPEDWAGRGAILAAAELLPRAKKLDEAARDLFRRTPGAAERLRDALDWTAHRYRRAGERKGGVVHVADFHPDPRAAVERVLGPLDRFAPLQGPAPRPVRPRVRQAPASAVSQAPPASPAWTAPQPAPQPA
ncbi:MAG TPA: hypothetical protein VEX11_06435, partial [Acetobacteraceae bacterium]|nr:hypothetical protein [Acetobacteraceae bacterium]